MSLRASEICCHMAPKALMALVRLCGVSAYGAGSYVLFKAAMYRLCMGARSTCQRMLAGTADPSGTLRYCQSERVAVALGEGPKSNCSRQLVPGLAREFHFGLDIHMEGYHGIRHKRRLMFVLWQVSKKPSGFQKRFWIASVTLRSVCISRFPIGLRSAWER